MSGLLGSILPSVWGSSTQDHTRTGNSVTLGNGDSITITDSVANMNALMRQQAQMQMQTQLTSSNTYTHEQLQHLNTQAAMFEEVRATLAFIETYLDLHHPEIGEEWRKVKAVQDRLKS